MAEEIQNKSHEHEIKSDGEEVESTDRGLFGHTGKKEDVIGEQFKEQARVQEPEPVKAEEPIKEEEKEHGTTLLELIHQDDDKSIPNSLSDEKAEEGTEKKRSVEESSIPVETSSETAEKKGFLEKVKEKLPGHHEDKKPEETTTIPTSDRAVECTPPVEEGEGPEKKSVIDKIKEQLPGQHAKTSDTEEAKEKAKE